MYRDLLDEMVKSGSVSDDDDKDVDRAKVLKAYRDQFPRWTKLVGSAVYSNKKYIGDIDLVSTRSIDDTYNWLEDNFDIVDLDKKGKRVMTLHIMFDGAPTKVNVWHSTPEELPTVLLAFSYPRQFNIAIRKKLKRLGYRLGQYGVSKAGKHLEIDNVRQIFDLAGIEYRSPSAEGKKLNL